MTRRRKQLEYIAQLQALSAKRASIERFAPLLNEFFNGIRLPAIGILNPYIFRARRNYPGKLFEHARELKYPPAESVLRKGRLNDVGESIFYGSLGAREFLYEIPIYDAQRPRLFTYAKIDKVGPDEIIGIVLGKTQSHESEMLSNLAAQVTIDYLHSEMSRQVPFDDEDLYNATIGVGRFLLRKEIVNSQKARNFVLLYPSIKAELTGYNIAMIPDLYDRNYRIKSVGICCMANFGANDWRTNTVNLGTVNQEGVINWRFDYKEMMERIKLGKVIGDQTLGGTAVPDDTVYKDIISSTDET